MSQLSDPSGPHDSALSGGVIAARRPWAPWVLNALNLYCLWTLIKSAYISSSLHSAFEGIRDAPLLTRCITYRPWVIWLLLLVLLGATIRVNASPLHPRFTRRLGWICIFALLAVALILVAAELPLWHLQGMFDAR